MNSTDRCPILCGFYIETPGLFRHSPWTSVQFSMGFYRNLQDFLFKSHGHSDNTPCTFHGFSTDFHVFLHGLLRHSPRTFVLYLPQVFVLSFNPSCHNVRKSNPYLAKKFFTLADCCQINPCKKERYAPAKIKKSHFPCPFKNNHYLCPHKTVMFNEVQKERLCWRLHFMCISIGFNRLCRPSRPGKREGHIIETTCGK